MVRVSLDEVEPLGIQVQPAKGSYNDKVEVELINKMIDALLVAGYGLREARWFSTCGMKYLIDLKAGVMLRRGEAEDGLVSR